LYSCVVTFSVTVQPKLQAAADQDGGDAEDTDAETEFAV